MTKIAAFALAASLSLSAWMPVSAQEFPSKPVRLVVPFPPGGPLDVAGRLIGRELQERWGQSVIVENKPGGTIGTEFIANSPPDGYSLIIISSSPLVTLPQMQKVPYDVLRDFVGITQTTTLTYSLMVNPDSGFTSIQQLLAAARKQPGKLNYASAGNGSGQHLYVELLKVAAGIDMTHVPYKGAAPAVQALLSGQVPIMLDVISSVIPLVKSNRARALMVTGSKPVEQLPGAVPFDSLFPGLDISSWHGIFARSGTPRPVLAKIATDIRQALKTPAVSNRFRDLGFVITGTSGDEFAKIVRNDYERWGEVIRKNKLRVD